MSRLPPARMKEKVPSPQPRSSEGARNSKSLIASMSRLRHKAVSGRSQKTLSSSSKQVDEPTGTEAGALISTAYDLGPSHIVPDQEGPAIDARRFIFRASREIALPADRALQEASLPLLHLPDVLHLL